MTLKQIYLAGLVVFSLAAQTFAAGLPPLQVGAASKVINNRLGSWVQGAGQPRKATKQRDDLEANGLYLSDGKTQLLLVSCDLAGLNSAHVVAIRQAMGKAANRGERTAACRISPASGPAVAM